MNLLPSRPTLNRPHRPCELARAAVLAVAIGLLAITAGRASPIERDLGEGLVYFRVHSVPADLPSDTLVQKRPCVLDLRFAHGEPGAHTLLSGWLKFHATLKTPVFVLVNGATAPTLVNALAERDEVAGLLTIGTTAQKPAPDITVAEKSGEERRAYEALENGTSVATLTTDNPDKLRNDEASLAHERAPEPVPGDLQDDGTAEPSTAPAKTKGPPIDAALQRAIHVYRALRATKKIAVG